MPKHPRTAGYVIMGAEGDIVHGNDWDPFGLPTYSILIGLAPQEASAWIERNPDAEFSLVPVYEGDADGAERVSVLPRQG